MKSLLQAARNAGVSLLKSVGLYDAVKDRYEGSHFGTRQSQETFLKIFRENKWGDKHSVSGTGSNSEQSKVIVQALPALFSSLGVRTFLDLPCGDFYWMKDVDLTDIHYTGGDLVPELVKQNQEKFGSDRIQFSRINLLVDRLPQVDLILCRDCLVHLSFAEGLRALRNICASESTYLLTTTFPGHPDNRDILTGGWRTLNLQAPPFSLPPPLQLINEGCMEAPDVADKSLGLWKIEDIKRHANRT